MKRLLCAALIASLTLIAHAAPCPNPDEITQTELLGEWLAQVEGAPAAVLTLRQHPEFAGTVRGVLEREGRRIELAGDVDDGDLTLEESQDGQRISAAWLGEAVEGSCGREFRGTWKAEGAPTGRPFVLKKKP